MRVRIPSPGTNRSKEENDETQAQAGGAGTKRNGRLAQSVELDPFKFDDAGSTPVPPTSYRGSWCQWEHARLLLGAMMSSNLSGPTKLSDNPYNVKMRGYMAARYFRRRAAAIEQLGGKCQKCGSVEQLEFDHRDAKLKKFNVAKAFAGMAEANLQRELKKCQLLCKECHELKSIKESGKKIAKGTHGTISAYRYCKCDLCRAAHNTHIGRWRRGDSYKPRAQLAHGTMTMYRYRGCRCKDCIAANTDRSRNGS